MKVLLSICIPSYNRSELLKRLTEQLLVLKSNKIEFVFLDDCSSDKKVIKYLQEVKQRDSRVSVYENEQNIGITKNYYLCLQHATGKYAMLLSNEDQIPDNFEQVVIPLLEDNNYNALYGYLKRLSPEHYAYKDEHPTEDTNSFDFIKNNYPQIVFRGHISGHIYKKEFIDFDILHNLSTLKDNYWPIAAITLMMMKTKNVLVTPKSFIIIGADCIPETETILKQKNVKKREIKYFFSLKKRVTLYNYYIEQIIDKKEVEEFKKILARYFIFVSFRKKRTGISQLKGINAIKRHPEIGKYFKAELKKRFFFYYLNFYFACFNKYFHILSQKKS